MERGGYRVVSKPRVVDVIGIVMGLWIRGVSGRPVARARQRTGGS